MVDLAIRRLSQVQIEGKVWSATIDKIPSLLIVAAGAGSRRGHILNLMMSRFPQNLRVIAVDNAADSDEIKPIRLKHGEQLSCPATCKAIRSLSRDQDGVASILIDVSCLSRHHIGALFAAVKQLANQGPVDLQIAYGLARFVKPSPQWSSAIRRIAPVNDDFTGWTAAPDKPIELVVSLGYEKGKAIGAAEYLEPGETWLFVPTSPEGKYLKEVQAQNKDLLQERDGKQLVYQVLSPVDAYHSLLSLVRGMRHVARPILLPFGPRVFFGLSLLVAMIIEEAAVWFVDAENTSNTDLGQPSPYAVIMSCRIEPTNSTTATTEL